ncbi:MAG: SAM-dependent methyltransferase, partial [Bdellovibrionales bacterium]|nr:SAM-dependent methyltransferase [Oligoflexia bacterium]
GKSYLGFILYDLVLKHLIDFELTSIESRPELIEKSQALAQKSGFTKMKFIPATIDDATLEGGADLVCALHACDTATDDAILFGIKHHAIGFALVPCCQAELAQSLAEIRKQKHAGETASFLYEFPLHRREFGSHLTNVIRTLFLRSKGYRVTVTELVGWEHSMKNELILAEKISDETHPESIRASEELANLLRQFPVKMSLLKNCFSDETSENT